MYKRSAKTGFTFLELMVVVSLISILLFFSIPRFQGALGASSEDKSLRWIITKVRILKDRAVKEQRLYLLHVELDANWIWISHADMKEDQLQKARENGLRITRDLQIQQVEFMGRDDVSSGRADIRFFPSGYSDKAAIVFQTVDDDYQSLVIEPFLARVEIADTLVRFGE
jgi:prepilin-type N-terminal cleavage/methylation domain-containing protein